MEFSEVTKIYWENKDWEDLEKVKSVHDLYAVARRVLGRMPKPIVEVCGPIATGGLDSREANLNVFNDMIKKLQSEGLNVFDQIPFQKSMVGLIEKFSLEQIREEMLNDFYLLIFKSGLISTFYFLPNWQSSKGASWEHEKAKELGIQIVYL